MMRRLLTGGIAFGTLIGALGTASTTTSCAPTPSNDRVTDILLPDFPTYSDNVDSYLQRRCGTLDCHGQAGRAYRLYGFSGYRLISDADGGLVTGQQPTTAAEVLANYQAAVGLEPEQMSRVVAEQGNNPERLLLLRKPLRLANSSGGNERHKGGPAMAENDDGYRCVIAWLDVRTVRPTTAGTDFEIIPQAGRGKMSTAGVASCNTAKNNP